MVADPPKGDPKEYAAAEPTANGVSALVPLEDLGSEKGGCCGSGDQVRRCLRANLLVLLTVVAVVAGVALGLGVSGAGGALALGPARLEAFAFPGELLLRLLKMIILPLVVCSLIGGAASLDPSALGRLGAWALLFFLVTTLLASALGVGLALALQPGAAFAAVNSSVEATGSVEEAPSKEVLDSFLDLVRSDPARPVEGLGEGGGCFSLVGRGRVLGLAGVATWTEGGFWVLRVRDIPRASGKQDGIVGGSSGPLRVRVQRVRTDSWRRFLNMEACVHKRDPTGG